MTYELAEVLYAGGSKFPPHEGNKTAMRIYCFGPVKITVKVMLTFASPQDFLKYSSKAGLDCDQIEVAECRHDN